LDNLKEARRYWKLKEEAQDRTFWRTQIGRDYGRVASQTTTSLGDIRKMIELTSERNSFLILVAEDKVLFPFAIHYTHDIQVGLKFLSSSFPFATITISETICNLPPLHLLCSIIFLNDITRRPGADQSSRAVCHDIFSPARTLGSWVILCLFCPVCR
jgi:hypothetical protein